MKLKEKYHLTTKSTEFERFRKVQQEISEVRILDLFYRTILKPDIYYNLNSSLFNSLLCSILIKMLICIK